MSVIQEIQLRQTQAKYLAWRLDQVTKLLLSGKTLAEVAAIAGPFGALVLAEYGREGYL